MRVIQSLLLLILTGVASAQIAVRGESVHTMAGPVLKNALVVVTDGKIAAMGPDARVPDGYRVLQAKVVTPGLIDAHSVVGLAGYLNQDHDQDQIERSAAIQPELEKIKKKYADKITWGIGCIVIQSLKIFVEDFQLR